jgi:PAS domain S-box-containing protein
VSKLLLVDDTPENLVALAAVLEPLGHELVLAESGRQALKQLLVHDFAAILLDVQMPELDGFETAGLIKERERTRHVPILFLTAISKDAVHVFRGYSAGAVDYILKPYDPEILRAKVSVFVDLHEKTEQLKRQEVLLRTRELAELRRAGEERYRNLAEAMPQIVFTTTAEGDASYVNEKWLEYTGLDYEETRRRGWEAVLHPGDVRKFRERWRRAIESGEPFEMELRFRRASDGGYRWHLARALPTPDEAGAVTSWVGTATDIDDQKRLEETQMFLLDAGAVLGSSLDYRKTLADVARLAVPHVADWIRIEILDEEGSLRPLEIAHADPTKLEFLHELERRYPTLPDLERAPLDVIRTLEPELGAEIPEPLLESVAVDDLHLALLRELGLKSWMCVPLVVRGRALGAITLVSAESGRVYGPDDLAVAEELARRAATAVDNAELYQEAEKRAQAARVLASVGDGVFLVDRDDVIRLWNPAAAAITGLAERELVGKRADKAIPGWAAVRSRVSLAPAPTPTGVRAASVPLEIDGRELWLSVAGVELDDGTVYAFRDLTEEFALEKMKSDFVATVSHELRTPLAAIYGSALTIRRTDIDLDDEMRDRLLQVIAEESDRLAQIVNDLLLASHLDSGRLQVTIESCDARDLIEGVLEAAQTHLPDGVTLQLDAPDQLPPVAADPGQLRQVLVNLVDNAVKYSPEGGPVQIELAQVDGHVRFTIRDWGVGIPAAEHDRIFEKFYRLDPNMTRGIGGTGLGLYICRELVRRVDGRIWVESESEHGSTFFVEIPLAGAGDREHRRRRRRAPAGAAK